ncbi:MAG: prolyl oligopeptidase family serine peptidase [Pyrinomonadaceae bacterium]
MKSAKILILLLTILFSAGFVFSQGAPDTAEIQKAIEKDGCTVADKDRVRICKFDYKFKGKLVEALSFRPVTDGKYPAVMLVPGYQGTPQRYINLGKIFARSGFAAMAVGTPGFGKTELEPDFLGKNTIDAFIEGYRKFKEADFVDTKKIGIYGYSRGAIAVSLMVPRLDDVKAAVFGGGVYDMKKAYEEVTIEGIKQNIEKETGATDAAFRERSSIYKVGDMNCPILIIHGEKDINVPVNQAYLLRDELKKHDKEFEIKIYEGADHSLSGVNAILDVFDFFSRKLLGKSAKPQPA